MMQQTVTSQRLVLEYPTGKSRWHQDTPVSLPRWQHQWRIHTEPDGMAGFIWLTDDEAAWIRSRHSKVTT